MDNKEVKKIADFLTDDPDIFNEMAVSTGAIAMGPAGNMPTKSSKPKSRKRRKKVALDDSESEPISPVINPETGKPDKGEVLYSDTQSEDTDDTVD